MRLWSLHPSYLDSIGLIALWREGLLARKVLLGQTKGYTRHPQLIRFREAGNPVQTLDACRSLEFGGRARTMEWWNVVGLTYKMSPKTPLLTDFGIDPTKRKRS